MGIEDWDQRVFAWLWRSRHRLRQIFGRAPSDATKTEDTASVALAEMEGRLQILGSAFAQRAIRVVATPTSPGWHGDVLLLPSVFGFARSRAANEWGASVCVALVATSCRLGLTLPAGLRNPAVADLLAAHWTWRQLAEDLPALRERLSELEVVHASGLVDVEGSVPAVARCLQSVAGVIRSRCVTVRGVEELAWVDTFCAAAQNRTIDFESTCVELDRRLGAWGQSSATYNHPFWGHLRPASTVGAMGSASEMPSDALPRGTERPGRVCEQVERIELSKQPEADNPLVHSFEKVHTAEEYRGGQKPADGTDELDDHLEALEELDIRQVVRSRERTHSLYRADALLDGCAPDLRDDKPSRPPDYIYPEWHARRGVYLHQHCQLYIETCRRVRPAVALAYVRDTQKRRRRELRQLEAELARLELRRRPTPRRTDGEEVDIDAVVDAAATWRAGHTPSSGLYVRQEKREPGLGICVLLDLSLSSDAYVDDQRVLDVSREAVFVVGEALDERRAALAVAGFHSNTRHDCRFVTIKAFGENWPRVRGRLAGLVPRGYTRVGPALRHATRVLTEQDFRRRVVIVVTDGQPTDYDRYEGQHGTADVRQAIREARRDGVDVFALAVSSTHRVQLGQMFDRDRYALLPHVAQLPRAMSQLMARLVREG